MMKQDTDKTYCRILLDILAEKGVTDVVCSPGSRNTPLLLGLSARDNFRKHFVVDERSAAFMALGLSLVSQQPVALVCTSGTALLNYSPAIAEAYYQGLPLIVISADRPEQWIDQDDSQTLRQNEALANFVKKSYSIPAYGDDNPELRWYVNRIVNDAVLSAVSGKKGPVHINISLSEPLGKQGRFSDYPQRLINLIEGDSIGNKEIIKNLAEEISNSKVLLVAGFMLPDAGLQKAISIFSRRPNIAIMAETISNLHLKAFDYSVDSVLTNLNEEQLLKLKPDLVITIGGALVSRKLKEYLRKNCKDVKHWAIGYNHTTVDTFMSLSLRIDIDPVRLFRNLNSALNKKKVAKNVENYQQSWEETRLKSLAVKQLYIESIAWSELRAFDIILKRIPSNYNLFLSNGTAIRYAQIIDYNLPHASYCNRGVSGIDGSVSTAIGGSLAYKGDSLLITGDLSFSYDIGAFNIQETPERFKIIVMDNQGGGIFRFISSTSGLEELEEYFCQPPKLPLKLLAEGYDWEYYEANDEKSLETSLKSLFASKRKSILRVVCDGKLSAEILKNYMKI
ncbi:MAG: 2-succinyl-5-enolpyruvyl-6-hydroxy-3-cyclohexene-1-carboxylic-acid synthase [Muribaculaceae bacterium]|nr:2-succinyl-5-enolpyruvyl-6-hydroxy-3-cyclohexene-1-carboxylic-acid synthase [Muribaculaceae bacterium]